MHNAWAGVWVWSCESCEHRTTVKNAAWLQRQAWYVLNAAYRTLGTWDTSNYRCKHDANPHGPWVSWESHENGNCVAKIMGIKMEKTTVCQKMYDVTVFYFLSFCHCYCKCHFVNYLNYKRVKWHGNFFKNKISIFLIPDDLISVPIFITINLASQFLFPWSFHGTHGSFGNFHYVHISTVALTARFSMVDSINTKSKEQYDIGVFQCCQFSLKFREEICFSRTPTRSVYSVWWTYDKQRGGKDERTSVSEL